MLSGQALQHQSRRNEEYAVTRNAKARPGPAIGGSPKSIAGVTTWQDTPTIPSTSEALIALAEELGRVLARRELARVDRRRGYSLVELIIGAAAMAELWILMVRLLGQ